MSEGITFNTTAEQLILAAILVHNESYHQASEVISSHDFYHELHDYLFDLFGNMISREWFVSPESVAEYVAPIGRVGEITVPEYVHRLKANNCGWLAIAANAQVVRDLAIKRGQQ